MENLRVLHITECLATGTLEFLKNLISAQQDFEHTIIYGSQRIAPEAKTKFSSKVRLIPWDVGREISPFKDLKSLISLMTIMRRLKFDVLHLHSSKAGFLGRICSRLLGIKNVYYTPHGVSFLRDDVSQMKRLLFIYLEKIAAQISGTVVCCSNSEKKEFLNNKIKAIHINNGIPINTSISVGANKTEKLIFVNSGRICFQKDPIFFNEIAKIFVNDPHVSFKWIGDGELRNSLNSPNIEITGWISQQSAIKELEAGSFFLSTSRWEGLSLSILEAMSLGVPLLLRDCIGNVDLVMEKPRNGFLFSKIDEAAKYIKFIESNISEYVNWCSGSRSICKEHFSIDLCALKYRDLYNDGA